jgi:hypothetical protein
VNRWKFDDEQLRGNARDDGHSYGPKSHRRRAMMLTTMARSFVIRRVW